MANFFTGGAQPQGQKPMQQQGGQTSPLDGAGGNIQQHQQTQASAMSADTNQQVAAPLDGFKGMWDSAATKPNDKPNGVLPAITAEQLNQTLANSNFLSGVDPMLLQKASSGDQQAFSDVINQGLRAVMTQSVLATHGLVEAGARGHGEQLRTTLPSMVRSHNVQDSLASNPLFSNPQAKPMVEMVRAQLEAKHPQASAREIADLTQQFIGDFAKLATPSEQQQVQKGKTASGDVDWYQTLGLGPLT